MGATFPAEFVCVKWHNTDCSMLTLSGGFHNGACCGAKCSKSVSRVSNLKDSKFKFLSFFDKDQNNVKHNGGPLFMAKKNSYDETPRF